MTTPVHPAAADCRVCGQCIRSWALPDPDPGDTPPGHIWGWTHAAKADHQAEPATEQTEGSTS